MGVAEALLPFYERESHWTRTEECLKLWEFFVENLSVVLLHKKGELSKFFSSQ